MNRQTKAKNLLSNAPFKAVLFGAALYCVLYLAFFWQTPLGRECVLDGAENITLARAISNSTLPREPFYRAMLYPFLLSFFASFNLTNAQLMVVVGIIGLIFHLLNTLVVSLLAYELYKTASAAVLAAFLYGFYPPCVFFIAEPSDVLPSMFFCCAALYLYIKHKPSSKAAPSLLSGFLLGIGGLFRPNVLIAAGLWAYDALFTKNKKAALSAILGVSALLLSQGVINAVYGGEFRILPWQGAYTFYATNSKRANGRYYRHELAAADRSFGSNPARSESEQLYRRETGLKEISDIGSFNKFWYEKAFSYIWQRPDKWLKLYALKLYYFFNDFEQHDNKTFVFHKKLSPILRYNPLSYGILLLLSVLALFNPKPKSKSFFDLSIALLFLSLGVLIFFVNIRFRLPIVPIIAAIAGGSIFSSSEYKKKLPLIAVVLCAVSFLTFSNYFEADSDKTFISDKLLIAHACSRTGDYKTQFKLASEALNESFRADILRLKLAAFANLALNGEFSQIQAYRGVSSDLELLISKNLMYSETALITACYAYRVKGDKALALAILRKALRLYPEKELYKSAIQILEPQNQSGSLNGGCKLLKEARSFLFGPEHQ